MLQSLKVTAFLAGSIALSRPEDISLDGILASQVLRRHFGNAFYTLPDPKEVLYFARLPLEMRGEPSPLMAQMETGAVWYSKEQRDESLWYWACSTAQIDVKGRDTQYWNKRFDTQAALSDHINFGGKVEKVIIEQGQFKAYHMPLSIIVAEKVVWYAYGNPDAIRTLLEPVSAISKKRVQGQGHVLRWEIEATTEDWSEWKDNKLMRPLPVLPQGVQPLEMQYIAFRAPQWHTANQAMCVVKAMKDA